MTNLKGITLYHTLENRGNKEEVRQNAPYLSIDKKNLAPAKQKWCGTGYYLWETFVDLARFWGNKVYEGNYYICKTEYCGNDNDVLDMTDTRNILSFAELEEAIVREENKRQINSGKKHTFKYLLEYFIRNNYNDKRIKAIRFESKSNYTRQNTHRQIGFYEGDNSSHFDLRPMIQWCVRDRNILKLPIELVEIESNCDGF